LCIAAFSTLQNISQLSLSADELVLACVAQNSVSFYSVPQLVNTADSTSAPRPLHQLTVESAVKQVAWCRDPQAPQWYLVVTEEQALLVTQYPGQASEVFSGVQAACWAPSGTVLGVSKGRRVEVVDACDPGTPLASVEVDHPDGRRALTNACMDTAG
jgi:hypothetical protein